MLSSSSIACLSASLGDKAKKDCLVLQIFSKEQMSSEMSSCCSCYVFSQWFFTYFFLVKGLKCFTNLYSLPKQLDNLIPRSSKLTVQFSGNYVTQLTSFFLYCQSEISQSKMEKIFQMNNNISLKTKKQRTTPVCSFLVYDSLEVYLRSKKPLKS